MKKFWLQMGLAIAVIVISYQFLAYYPRVFNSGGVQALPLLILSILGIGLGWLLEFPLLLSLIRGKGGRHFHPDLLFGQGIPALMLALSRSISRILADSPMPDFFYGWMDTYPAPLGLLGFTWLGIVILQSLSPQAEMFHVKQRRRKRDQF